MYYIFKLFPLYTNFKKKIINSIFKLYSKIIIMIKLLFSQINLLLLMFFFCIVYDVLHLYL